jgi:hypothetical protein
MIRKAWIKAKADTENTRAVPTDPCARFADYRGDEIRFLKEVFNMSCWAAQRAIVKAVLQHRMVTIRSCRKGSKTYTLAALAEIFAQLHESVVVTIGPSQDQLKANLWGDIRDLHSRATRPLLGKCDTMQIRIGPKHYVISITTDKVERMQGFHAGVTPPSDNPDRDLTEGEIVERFRSAVEEHQSTGRKLVFLIDEAPGVAQVLLDALKGSLSGPDTYVVMAGNPLQDIAADHEFAHSHRPGSGWHRIKITALDGYDDPLDCDEEFRVPNWILDPAWIKARKKEWGESSPLFRAYVLGQFAAEGSERKIITYEMMEAALQSYYPSELGTHIGVDIAREGSDVCVASRWSQGMKTAEYEWSDPDLMRTAEIIAALRARWGENGGPLPATNIHLDATGMGGGVVDRLRQMGLDVDAVDFGTGAEYDWIELTGETTFQNRRTELYWALRRALQEGLAMIPKDYAASWREAQWTEYEVEERASGTHIAALSKKKVRAQFGKSPDHIDADILAWSRSGDMTVGVIG